MSNKAGSDLLSLTNDLDYEVLIEQRFLTALKSSGFKKMGIKLNFCIGLMVLKLFLDVGGASYLLHLIK